MNTAARKWGVGLMILGTLGSCAIQAGDADEAAEAAAMMSQMGGEQQAAAARAKDPSWKPASAEVALIRVGDRANPGALRNFCLNAEGQILACVADNATGGSAAGQSTSAIRVYSPQGQLVSTLPLSIRPMAICVAPDGTILVAGDGKVLRLDSAGKVLASGVSPVAGEKVVVSKEVEDMVREMAKENKRPVAEELAAMKQNLEDRRQTVTGIASTGNDVFLAVPSPNDFTYRVYRLDAALKDSALVVNNLRGCCGQMDVQAHDGKLWIPHNARHRIECRDRDGKELAQFGKAGRVKAADFGGCCEPKNLRVLANGDILAAESGPPTCIKRFSSTGKFLGVVGLVDNPKGDCVRVTVAASPDATRYYLLDTTQDAIRVFAANQ